MPTKVAMNPWSPSPWTVGGKRSTDERTPMPRSDRVSSAVAARRPAGLARISALGHEPVVLGGHPTGGQPEHARGEHEGPVGAGQGRAHGLDGPPVGRRGGGEVAAEGHLVLEGQVDHPVGVGGRLGQAVGVVDVAPLHGGAGRLQPLRRCLGAGQADHLVAGSEQLGHDGRADPARCAGDEDLHGGTSGTR